jgi:hypothetical protein
MDEYLIGAGALLTAGPEGSITAATLHAQMVPGLAGEVEAALVDFESGQLADVSRLLIIAAGWSGPQFRSAVFRKLLAQRQCELADVILTLAHATGAREIHLFARWRPDEATVARLRERGVGIISHPLDAIGQAALVCGQRLERWRPPVRAA